MSEHKEDVYTRLKYISNFSKLPCWNKEKCELNLEKLEQDVLRYMIKNIIFIKTGPRYETNNGITKDFLLVYNDTSKELQNIIGTITSKTSFQVKMAYLRENIDWLSTSKHWNKETMCLDYDGLRRDIVRGLEAFAKEGKTKAEPTWSEGHLLVRDIILFEKGMYRAHVMFEVSKALPFDYEVVWDWSQKE